MSSSQSNEQISLPSQNLPTGESHHSNQPIHQNQNQVQDCLTCRIIGTGAFGAVGLYALRQSRLKPGQPGAARGPVGRRIMAGVGMCFLGLSYLRWNMSTSSSESVEPAQKFGRNTS